MKFSGLLAVLAVMAVTALATPVLKARQEDCVERCQDEFIECFTNGDTFEHCEALRGMERPRIPKPPRSWLIRPDRCMLRRMLMCCGTVAPSKAYDTLRHTGDLN